MANNPSGQSCSNCKFWKQYGTQINPRIGNCRRYPPKKDASVNDHVVKAHPLTRDDWWCGKWSGKDGTEGSVLLNQGD